MGEMRNIRGRGKIFFLLVLSPLFSLSPLFPSSAVEVIGIYGVPPKEYGSLKELGIDTVVLGIEASSSTKRFNEDLNQLGSFGFKIVLGIFKNPFDYREAINAVETYKFNPNIRFWYLIDQPDLPQPGSTIIDPPMVQTLNDFVHLTDPQHRPTLVTLSDANYAPPEAPHPNIHGKSYSYYKESADVIGVIRLTSAKDVKSFLTQHVEESMHDKRWWGIVSLRQKPENLKKAVNYFMEAGAKGILYYSFLDPEWGFDLRENEAIRKALKEANATLQGMDQRPYLLPATRPTIPVPPGPPPNFNNGATSGNSPSFNPAPFNPGQPPGPPPPPYAPQSPPPPPPAPATGSSGSTNSNPAGATNSEQPPAPSNTAPPRRPF